MSILKLALLGSLRIALPGSLKIALFVYALFLSDTLVTNRAAEDNGGSGDTASYGATQSGSSGNANVG
jgi:hypothetical protein